MTDLAGSQKNDHFLYENKKDRIFGGLKMEPQEGFEPGQSPVS